MAPNTCHGLKSMLRNLYLDGWMLRICFVKSRKKFASENLANVLTQTMQPDNPPTHSLPTANQSKHIGHWSSWVTCKLVIQTLKYFNLYYLWGIVPPLATFKDNVTPNMNIKGTEPWLRNMWVYGRTGEELVLSNPLKFISSEDLERTDD